MVEKLPEKFEKKMQLLLGKDFEAFLNGFSEVRFGGVRYNRLKTNKQQFEACVPFSTRPVEWIDNGYYYDLKDVPSKHPYYFAGLYYIQEPSAMTPANIMPVEEGDRVLDICAAPGGKSTELLAKLGGSGVLFSNDISNSRAKALLKNLELFGARNAVILSEAPGKLTNRFLGYFDKILIDAPCSGEGMFRKSPAIMRNWEQYGPEYYHKLQLEILDAVLPMLRPGGMLVYSTCTFDEAEDEGSLQYILENYPDMHVVQPELSHPGFDYGHPEFICSDKEEITKAIRIWPHRIQGEGHFVALLKKDEADEQPGFIPYKLKGYKPSEEVLEFFKHINLDIDWKRVESREDRLYLIPQDIPELSGLRIMRTGLLLGEEKKGRFEPSQALAMALSGKDYDNIYNLPADDEDVIKYLKCETIDVKSEYSEGVRDGFVLVCTDNLPLGWAKNTKGTLKNKYLPGWRMM